MLSILSRQADGRHLMALPHAMCRDATGSLAPGQ